ncbi:sulfatase-like hydrolase/transferase [Kushneria indalinina]|uniref:Phosphoglycerol transferase MdoB-like AlkP superfamily enzyme n=1 Tax=Kushneria indalinina DSM 14324 TaxID=1122140 RepID=A0A3D9DRM4_9GAMM|nr:sulfatase-like hydrolase/transferase [Kushneria indalinina]REC93408.1 phosphoglycerol transferase MdoB-like AlkP superfamily enzyme [Kushneria indalinina DSM 14324]
MVITLLLGYFVLALPHQTSALNQSDWWFPPLELPLMLLALWCAPRRIRHFLAPLLAVVLLLVVLIKLADMVALQAYWRIFDPISDWRLLGPGWNVLSGTIGADKAWLLAAAVSAALLLVLALMITGLLLLARHGASGGPKRSRVVLWTMATGLLLVSLSGLVWHDTPRPAESSRLVVEHVAQSRQNLQDLAALKEHAEQDPIAGMPAGKLLSGLKGHDVLFVFIESYGRTALEDERYAGVMRSRMAAIDDELGQAGFGARSAWLASPTVGGQSWLAHATLQSGLWINSQRRYNWLLGTERVSLARLFNRAGWRTMAVEPALTREWLANRYYRFDQVYDARNLGYKGEPFNWVTMPDQYTYATLQRLELADTERAPVMAEIATLSSHAPWTPIPPLIDWAQVGDGRIFNQWASAGDPPDVVWQDSERVRSQYLKSVDYALETLASFVTHYGDDNLVVIAMGDHQPATLITGEGASLDVPVHVMSRDASVLDQFEEWGWHAGMLPDQDSAHWGMDALRQRLIEGFGAP